MKRKLCCLAFLALAYLKSQVVSTPVTGTPSDQKLARLTGNIVDAGTGYALFRAQVFLRPTAQISNPYEAQTLEHGAFTISDIPPGEYVLFFRKTGYSMPVEKNTLGTTIRLAPGQHLAITAKLARGAVVTGRVTGSDGEAIPFAQVEVDDGGRYPTSRAVADEDGRFKLANLPQARYKIFAFAPRTLADSQEIRTDGSVNRRYARTYYPGVREIESATFLDIKWGQMSDGIDIQLQTAPEVTIEGTVQGAPRSLYPQIEIQIYDAAARNRVGSAVAFPDGHFRVSGLDPAVYRVRAEQKYPAEWFSSPVVIDARSTSNPIMLRLSQTIAFEGQLKADDGATKLTNRHLDDSATSRESMFIRFYPVELPSAGFIRVRVEPDGAFRVTGLRPNRYWTAIEGDLSFVQSVWMEDQEKAGPILDLRDGVVPRGAIFKLSSRTGQFDGEVSTTISDANRRRVVVIREELLGVGPVTSKLVSDDGKFSITGLAPGKYVAALVDDTDMLYQQGIFWGYEEYTEWIEVREESRVTRVMRKRDHF